MTMEQTNYSSFVYEATEYEFNCLTNDVICWVNDIIDANYDFVNFYEAILDGEMLIELANSLRILPPLTAADRSVFGNKAGAANLSMFLYFLECLDDSRLFYYDVKDVLKQHNVASVFVSLDTLRTCCFCNEAGYHDNGYATVEHLSDNSNDFIVEFNNNHDEMMACVYDTNCYIDNRISTEPLITHSNVITEVPLDNNDRRITSENIELNIVQVQDTMQLEECAYSYCYSQQVCEVVRCLHLLLSNEYGIKSSIKLKTHSVQEILGNNKVEIRVDTRIKNNTKVGHDRPYIFVKDKIKNIITLKEVDITNQNILQTVETEKLRKHDLLATELSMIHKCKVDIIPFVFMWDKIGTTYHERYRKLLKGTNRIEAYIQSKVLHKTLSRASHLTTEEVAKNKTPEGEDMTEVIQRLVAAPIEEPHPLLTKIKSSSSSISIAHI